MSEALWKHDMYINENDPFLFNTEIIEYDMKDAGFSLIKEYKLLDKKTIDRIEKLEKKRRHITIGKMDKIEQTFRNSEKVEKFVHEYYQKANQFGMIYSTNFSNLI